MPCERRRRRVRTESSDQSANASPWLTVREVAARARCGVKIVYWAIRSGKLRHARLNEQKLVVHVEWVDSWVLACATPSIVEVTRRPSVA